MKQIKKIDESRLDLLSKKELESTSGGNNPPRDVSFKIGPGQISPGIGVSVVF